MVVLQDILNVSNREQAADAQSLLLVTGDALKDMESKDVDIPASMKDLLQSCDNKRRAVATGTSMKKKRSEPINKFPTSDFPDSDEIRHSDRPPLIPETRDKGLYESTTECINAQLQMTRERFAAAIRERISRYHALYDSNKVSPDDLNRVPVYQSVTLRSIVESSEQRIGLTYRMHFDNSPFQSVKWDTSTQLLKGSVVCLSFDHFKTLVYGIVSKRQAKWLRQGLVELHIPHKEDVVSLLVHDTFYMIDCRVMEDGVINVLSTLRLLTDVTMPLQNHFIGMDSPQKAASFCRDDDSSCLYDLSELVKEEIQHRSAKARATSVPLTDVKCWPEVTSSCLDEFQMKAMRAALTQEFTAIAGAPATGKRYLGLKIIEILLQNRHVWGRSIGSTSCSRADVDSGPILVLSADDSSLDHFLKGVLTFQGKGIIRFGRKSSDPQINAIDASNVARTSAGASKQPGVEELRAKLSQLHRNIKEAKGTILQASSLRPVMDEHHFESISQNGGMAAWILPEEMQDGHATDDTSVGNIHGEEREWTECSLAVAYDPKERAKQGKEKESKMVLRQLRHHEVMKKEKIQSITNLWSLPPHEKWNIYRFWVAMYEQEVSHRVLDICQEVDNIMHEVAKGCRASEYSVFRAASVLGMTASATVANHDVLRYVQPRIIIVDQAQDVAEAVLISTLSPDCRQLILLGECEPNVEPDVAVSASASRSDVKMSFFQRILDKNYAVNNLKIQHRMRPEISKFLKREMYPDLMDGSSVTRFSNVPGVAENVYFLRHGLTGNEASKHEAEFLSELCQYVTLQGHNGDISILVNSVKQQEQVKEILGKADLQHVVVDLLDTFQGESDLVLLATYGMYQIRDGRLRNEVRMKRALTRARKGLYVISNIDVLAKKSASILTFFEEAERLTRGGPQLTLTCSTHRDQSTLASKPGDIRKRIQLKGCGNICHKTARTNAITAGARNCAGRNASHARSTASSSAPIRAVAKSVASLAIESPASSRVRNHLGAAMSASDCVGSPVQRSAESAMKKTSPAPSLAQKANVMPVTSQTINIFSSMALKGCPKCSTPIRKNLRYGNVIKRALADIEAVKQKMMGSTKELKGKRRQLKKNLGALSKSANGGMDESAFKRFRDKLDDCNHLETVVSRLNRCNFMKEVIALERQVGSIEGPLREESATKRVMKSLHDIAQFKLEPLSARLDKMKHRLCDGDLDRFAEQQVDDMMSEIIRTGMEIDLAHLLSRDLAWWDKHPVFQTRVMDFDALLASGKPLTLEQESEAKSIITTIRKEQGIEEAPGLGISERERMQVVQAMGLSQGHWFKCREGHIYAIGECGGAMERGQCPECGGTIGGQRHRLTDENRLAGEMDKAQQAAWSKGGAAAPF
ncbi:NFX1-type zinc finger-containing protein 1-like [Diadema antillarum]|uniref:NFX1-type zinc finger-containing protein 1-like n=1 Tax=Diadema antillarum TaxID=105358 RepID=UPI003A892D81